MKNYLITESQLERITNLIISEQSVVGAPNFGTIGSSDRFTNKKNETKPIKGFDCVPYAFRHAVSTLKKKGYNPLILKAALGTIGRESSFGSGNRFKFLNPLKTLWAHLGGSTSVGYGQVKPETAKQYGMNIDELNSAIGALTTIYKILSDNYNVAKKVGFTNSKSMNGPNGTGNSALDMAIVAYNAGRGKIVKYCQTSNPKLKRDCKYAGQTIKENFINEEIPSLGGKEAVLGTAPKTLKVFNNPVINYVPNFKTKRWDGVNISSHGYVEEVNKRIKEYGCL